MNDMGEDMTGNLQYDPNTGTLIDPNAPEGLPSAAPDLHPAHGPAPNEGQPPAKRGKLSDTPYVRVPVKRSSK